MPLIYRCPKCDARFDPPRPEVSECPQCGIWFHKWGVTPEAKETEDAHADEASFAEMSPAVDPFRLYGRAAALIFIVVWGVRLAAMDYRNGEINGSFMHNIVLPIHEAGHVFFIPFGEFFTILGGNLFQVALPLAIGTAFLLRQRDGFGAAICLWWAGASVVDVAPYIWDSLNPQLVLLGGHTGEDGPHDWIYLLGRLGAIKRAHIWGTVAHHVGTLMMLAGIAWGGRWLWQQKPRSGRSALS